MRINAIDYFFFLKYHKCTKKTIPNRKNIAVIAIGMWKSLMMTDFVYIWRHEKITQKGI